MKDNYNPEYAKGEILVCPREATLFDKNPDIDFGDEFFRAAGLVKGYVLSDEDNDLGMLVFKVKPGKEKAAIDYFKGLQIKINDHQIIKPVGYAGRRDIKMEKRLDDLEELVSIAESIRDNPELSPTEYNKQLALLIDYSQKLKEP